MLPDTRLAHKKSIAFFYTSNKSIEENNFKTHILPHFNVCEIGMHHTFEYIQKQK